MQQARDRVDTRLERLESLKRESDRTAPMESIAMLCSGTDLIGPELEDEISRSTKEAIRLLEAGTCDCAEPPVCNCASPTVIAGILVRTFWLGYESRGS